MGPSEPRPRLNVFSLRNRATGLDLDFNYSVTTESVLPGAEILGFSVCIYEAIPAFSMRTTEPMTPALHEARVSAEVMRTPLFGVDSFRRRFLSN